MCFKKKEVYINPAYHVVDVPLDSPLRKPMTRERLEELFTMYGIEPKFLKDFLIEEYLRKVNKKWWQIW